MVVLTIATVILQAIQTKLQIDDRRESTRHRAEVESRLVRFDQERKRKEM